MKERYDKNTTENKFKPGDKVLAILPVLGRTLQGRYFGLYSVEKKVSDLDYVINFNS